jgi:hypothetical protein
MAVTTTRGRTRGELHPDYRDRASEQASIRTAMAKFEKGKSGNPGGRPVGLEQRLKEELAGDVPALIEALREIALGKRNPKTGTRRPSKAAPKDRIAAAKELFDRVLGKARQSLEVSSEGPAVLLEALGLTTAQRDRRRAELEAKAKAGTAPAPGG